MTKFKVVAPDGSTKEPGMYLCNVEPEDKVFRIRRGEWVEIPREWLAKTPRFAQTGNSQWNKRPRRKTKGRRRYD